MLHQPERSGALEVAGENELIAVQFSESHTMLCPRKAKCRQLHLSINSLANLLFQNKHLPAISLYPSGTARVEAG